MTIDTQILARAAPATGLLPPMLDAIRRPTRQAVSVLHVFRYFRPDFTGEGIYLEKLAPLLSERGIAGEIVAEATSKRPGGHDPAGKAQLFGRGMATGGTPYWANRRILAWLARNAAQFDVVHFHSAIDRMFSLQAVARLSGCRVVQSSTLDDGLGSLVDGYRPAFRPLARSLCRLIDASVAISPHLHDDSARVARPGQLHLISQGVDVRAWPVQGAVRADARARFGLAEDDVALLFVGGLCVRKGVDFLLHNHAALDRARARLLVVGPDLEDGHAETLRGLAAQSGGRITLHGYMDDPAPAFCAADAFVFASTQEGFGNALLEAMAHGLPVVSRHLPGVTDQFIEHGRTGLLFETAAQYRTAVQRLIDDPTLRRRLGEAARQAVAQDFSLAAAADRYAALYRSLVRTTA